MPTRFSFCLLVAFSALVAAAFADAQGPWQLREGTERVLPLRFDARLIHQVVFGDIDGDGDLDLVVASEPRFVAGAVVGGQDRLYRNDGRGVFTDITATNLPVEGDATMCAVFADVDGDGDLDLVQGNSTLNAVAGPQDRLLLNDGTGVFTDVTATNLPIDNDYAQAIAAGDVDGDGDIDLILANQVQNRLWLNVGGGVFVDATAGRLPSPNSIPTRALLEDLDGDGDLDLVVCNTNGQSELRIYTNNGLGTFTDVTAAAFANAPVEMTDAALFDADGDGDLDLVAVSATPTHDRFYRNNGNGVFVDATPPLLAARQDSYVLAADVDLDGDRDLVLVGPYHAELLVGQAGSFVAAPPGKLSLHFSDLLVGAAAVADVDGNATPDLVLAGGSLGILNGGEERLFRSDGTGAFFDAAPPELPVAAGHVVLGDIDGDGDLDVLLPGAAPRLFRNDGKQRFVDVTATSLPPAFAYSHDAAFADFDGDGDLDLLLAQASIPGGGAQNALWLNNGAGVFVDATATHLPPGSDHSVQLAVGDVDGDGDLDVVIGNDTQPGGSQQNRLLRNTGNGHFVDATATAMVQLADDGALVDLADLDGDGDLDLVQTASSASKLFENVGGGIFAARGLGGVPATVTTAQAVGDVNGDGRVDIVLCYFSVTGQHLVAANQGNWAFSMAPVPPTGGRAYAVRLGDLDGDGALDAIVVGGSGGAFLRNNGSGTFTDASAAWLRRYGGTGLALGDVDRDGDLDLLVAGAGDATRIFYNQHLQHAVPDPANPGYSYRVEISARPGYLAQPVFAAPLFSLTEVQQPLPPWGVLGIDPTAFVVMPTMSVLPPGGTALQLLQVPPAPALYGLTFFSQTMFLDPNTPAQPLHLSGALFDVVH